MNEIKWNDRFNIGVDSIDRAHQRLFSIVSKLISLNEDPDKQQHACREGIKYLKSYTIKHFADEERYMRFIDYEGYAVHKRLHDNMCQHTLPALEAELELEDYSTESVQHFLGICIGWLNAHIMIEDAAIAGRVANKWVHQPSEDELASLERAVVQALESLFGMKSQLVSDHYSGEDFSFGKALCYRLCYAFADGKKRYVYLIYEEKMIFTLLGDMLGQQIRQVDKTVFHAMKLLSQKFVSCISAHFALTDDCELEKNDAMTFEQLQRVFKMSRAYPPYSLLFCTEKNDYLAVCIQ